jgi:hypothetical protein
MHRFEFQFARNRLANTFVNLATSMSFRADAIRKTVDSSTAFGLQLYFYLDTTMNGPLT